MRIMELEFYFNYVCLSIQFVKCSQCLTTDKVTGQNSQQQDILYFIYNYLKQLKTCRIVDVLFELVWLQYFKFIFTAQLQQSQIQLITLKHKPRIDIFYNPKNFTFQVARYLHQKKNQSQVFSKEMTTQYLINNPQQVLVTQNLSLTPSVASSFTAFLQTWTQNSKRKYISQANVLIKQSNHIMLITTKDVFNYDDNLGYIIMNEYSRYESVLNKALTEFMYHVAKNSYDENADTDMKMEENKQIKQQNLNETYEVAFDKGFMGDYLGESVRDLKCEMLGKLRSIVGTVTRVSEVRPELIEGVFQCGHCEKISQRIPQQFKYTTPKKCLNGKCDNNTLWQLNNKQSVFADFQKVRVQQDSSKIPPGSMPRSIDVILRNQNIQKGQPGDQIHVVGYLSVLPDISSLLKPGQRTSVSSFNPHVRKQAQQQQGINGMKGIKQLSYNLCFIGINVYVMNNQFNEEILTQEQAEQAESGMQGEYNEEMIMARLMKNFNQSQILEIKRIKENPKIYEHLAQSLFHEIFGHMEVKKSLLLQLLGGIHKKTQTRISIRGDINILIVGDPSTAKSQFLKCVNKFVPRSVYTNGKTTSAAGLTASVVRDQQSGNVSIEAGALLLADNGICCIDEFDKMQLKDQVAIHEAMQQQTISIAKAGIQATLHARTSILAAANPIFGRYDKSQSLRKNINISPPIMSRFDLYFIICDEVNDQSDRNLSQFIVSMHQSKKQIKVQKPYTIKQVKNYLSLAKKIKPRLTKEAAQDLRKNYVQLRKRDKQSAHQGQYQVTVRQLESMIRLSEALAKLHLDHEVKSQYVREAYRLLQCSVVKMQKPTVQLADEQGFSLNEKASLGLMNILNQREVQKKSSRIQISQQVYAQVYKDVMKLFQQKQYRHITNRIQDAELYLTQEDVIAYLSCISYENGDLSSENQNEKTKKLFRGIINYMIKEHVLVVLDQSDKSYERRLCLHPNVELCDSGEGTKK